MSAAFAVAFAQIDTSVQSWTRRPVSLNIERRIGRGTHPKLQFRVGVHLLRTHSGCLHKRSQKGGARHFNFIAGRLVLVPSILPTI